MANKNMACFNLHKGSKRLSEDSISWTGLFIAVFSTLLSKYKNSQQFNIYCTWCQKMAACSVCNGMTLGELASAIDLQLKEGENPEAYYDTFDMSITEISFDCQGQKKTWSLTSHLSGNEIIITSGNDNFTEVEKILFLERLQMIIDRYITDKLFKIGDSAAVGAFEENLLHAFSAGDTSKNKRGTFHHFFQSAVKKYPERTAVICADQQITYRQLDRISDCVANYIYQILPGKENLIGICMERSISFVTAIIGIMKSGNAYVPIDPDTLNPGYQGRFPQKRLDFMIHDANIKLIVTNSNFIGKLTDIASCFNIDSMDPNFQINIHMLAENNPDCLAYGIYTSGSTGQPKLTLIRHGSIINLWENLKNKVYTGIDSEGYLRVTQNAPFGFDASVQQLVCLLGGNTLCIIPERERNSIHKMISYLIEKKCDVFDCTPPQLRLLFSEGFLEKCGRTVRAVIVGGEQIPVEMWDKMRRSETMLFYNAYGPTECTVDSTLYKINGTSHFYPVIGRPLDNCSIYILDENQKQVPVGFPGEICITGEGVAKGYYNRKQLNDSVFIQNPFGHGLMYRSGDMGRFQSDGCIVFTGRKDHQIKIRSHRIELDEIAKALCGHDDIVDAVVAVSNHSGYDKLIAYLILRDHTRLDSAEINLFLSEYLPAYMIPNHYVTMKSWPLTANKKIDRTRLPLPGDFVKEKLNSQSTDDELMTGITQIVKKILHKEAFAPTENFMISGGDSLQVMLLLSEILKKYNVEVDFADFLEEPTILNLKRKILSKKGREQASEC